MRFDRKYFLLTICIFLVLVGIALFVNDEIVRPYAGDTLATIFVFSALMSVFKISVNMGISIAVCFSYLIELTQYFNLIDLLGLQNNELAILTLGSSASWGDIVAYTTGGLIVLGINKIQKKSNQKIISK